MISNICNLKYINLKSTLVFKIFRIPYEITLRLMSPDMCWLLSNNRFDLLRPSDAYLRR